jgi:DNA repair ATPase RecN
MFKIDEIKNFFDCDYCNQVLVDPVSIPCGSNLCIDHLDKLLRNVSTETNIFQCQLCEEEHTIPKNGFKINKKLQRGLEIQLNTLKLTPVSDECKTVINRAKEKFTEIETLKRNSEGYIYEYFEDVKRQVDTRREDLKMKIDKYSDEVIQLIEGTQANYIKISQQVNQISTNIEQSKKELDEYVERFNTLDINDKKYEDIKQGVVGVNKKFDKIILDYNNSLIGNKEYSFKFNVISIADVFGRLYEKICVRDI